MIIIINNAYDYSGAITFLLQDHLTMSDVTQTSDEQSRFVSLNVHYYSIVSRQCLTVNLQGDSLNSSVLSSRRKAQTSVARSTLHVII